MTFSRVNAHSLRRLDMLSQVVFALLLGSCVAQNNTTATTNVTMTPTVMTTRMPTEIPNPVYEKGTFTLNDTDNKPCIVATMAAMLTVTYKKTDNATADTDIILPQDMVAISGNCGQYNNGKYSSNLTLTWDNGYFSLSMIFEEDSPPTTPTTQPTTAGPTTNETEMPTNTSMRHLMSVQETEDGKQYVSQMSFTYNTASEFFENAEEGVFTATTDSDGKYFEGDQGTKYKCNSQQEVPFADQSGVKANFKDVLFEPFYDESENKEVYECDSDKERILIPIIVGSILGVLLVVTVIAFLVGRSRQQRGGYETI
ncbi:lysosome-associated membrane glycoprotein 1-like isoform X2 [Corticium candelabrum]|uniref:lysosome-associated membrane glycoprotein 1-like isoform X2 n=1 Tax=Corticium candelabrum TaxID=121492 RepID=UPI002E269DFE|nr:lysosome-associated membrane glycoprotein 1-like isoform X2 [Corticium candelabrum]